MVCFDFMNYLEPKNDNFITYNGIQMKALMAMMERVAEPRDDDVDYITGNIASMEWQETFFWEVSTFLTALPLTIINLAYIFKTITLP